MAKLRKFEFMNDPITGRFTRKRAQLLPRPEPRKRLHQLTLLG